MSKAAILAKKRRQEALAARGADLNRQKWDEMRSQMAKFEGHLSKFAVAHKDSIQRDPVFRADFHRMCATLGVDPLTSRKGMWAEVLGVGDYYYELAVRSIEICVATRPLNGGVISLKELVRLLRKKGSARNKGNGGTVDVISKDDVERAVAKLEVLGDGYKVVTTAKKGKLVTSIPLELSLDHTTVLDLAEDKGYVTAEEISRETKWPSHRVKSAVDYLLKSEIAWIDSQTRSGKPQYWVLGLLKED